MTRKLKPLKGVVLTNAVLSLVRSEVFKVNSELADVETQRRVLMERREELIHCLPDGEGYLRPVKPLFEKKIEALDPRGIAVDPSIPPKEWKQEFERPFLGKIDKRSKAYRKLVAREEGK